ncbi:MAG TPA: D-aminoacylase [Candidatus Solibacter sp.]|nr:D-aminoacylase [Candidatus Solibacter sp.]
MPTQRLVSFLAIIALGGSLAWSRASAHSPAAVAPYDVLIRNGRIVDGTGSPWYSGDLAIRDGRIAAIGVLCPRTSPDSACPAKQTINAAGRVVAPGFIDMLGQSELTILVNPHLPSKIFQGITTEITGEGGSVAPLSDALVRGDRDTFEHYHLTADWRTLAQYFARLEKQGMGINLATYVGATQVRRVVLGDADVQPTPAQLDQMRALVRQAMLEGAVGVSTSLEYAPAPYAKTEEIIALASVASEYGGIYASHMRSEGDAIDAALDETFRIGREAHIPVEIWHLKVSGISNWGKMPHVVERIDAARASGVDVGADTYAYPAWFNTFSAFIPPWAHDGGDAKLVERLKDPALRARIRKEMETPSKDWDNEWDEVRDANKILVGVVHNPALKSLQGKTIAQISKLWGKDTFDTIFDLLIQDNAFTEVAVYGMDERDIRLAVEQPWVSFDNDSSGTSPEGLLGEERPHPRAYGTFPRIIRKYVREEKRIWLEETIGKMTALPAQRMRLTDRGVLKTGMWADVVVFDPEKLTDRATFEEPNQLSVGMDYVLVNGVPVISEGKMTNALPGRVLRGPGYRPTN